MMRSKWQSEILPVSMRWISWAVVEEGGDNWVEGVEAASMGEVGADHHVD